MIKKGSTDFLQKVNSAQNINCLKETYDQWEEKYDEHVSAFGYKEPHQMILGEVLNFPSDYFESCQSIGVFTAGHAHASAFDELLRVLCSGAYIVFSLMEDIYVSNGYKDKFETLEDAGKWQLAEKKKFPGLPLEDPERFHRVYVYRIC